MGENKSYILKNIVKLSLPKEVAERFTARISAVQDTKDEYLMLPRKGLFGCGYEVKGVTSVLNPNAPCCIRKPKSILYWRSDNLLPDKIADDILFESFNAALHDKYQTIDKKSRSSATMLMDYGTEYANVEGEATFHFANLINHIKDTIPLTKNGKKACDALNNRNLPQYKQYTCDTPHKTGEPGPLGWKSEVKYAYERISTIGSMSMRTAVLMALKDIMSSLWNQSEEKSTLNKVFINWWRPLNRDTRPSALVYMITLLRNRLIHNGQLPLKLSLGTFGFPEEYHNRIIDWATTQPGATTEQEVAKAFDTVATYRWQHAAQPFTVVPPGGRL